MITHTITLTPLTWNELADLFDAEHGGRRARTLPMDLVAKWAERQKNRFAVDNDGNICLKERAQ